jgi:hypothetical protein
MSSKSTSKQSASSNAKAKKKKTGPTYLPDGTVISPDHTVAPGTPAPDSLLSDLMPRDDDDSGWKTIPWQD